MTAPQVRQRSAAKARAYDRLYAAIAANGGTTPCRERADFTADIQHPLDSAEMVDLCRRECPVLMECHNVAVLLDRHAKAGSVIAGVRYDLNGRPVDLVAELHELIEPEAVYTPVDEYQVDKPGEDTDHAGAGADADAIEAAA
jgi:hypothetical protein